MQDIGEEEQKNGRLSNMGTFSLIHGTLDQGIY